MVWEGFLVAKERKAQKDTCVFVYTPLSYRLFQPLPFVNLLISGTAFRLG